MDLVEKTKLECGYVETARLPICSECIHYRSIKANPRVRYSIERKKRCQLWGFPVKKMGTCNHHEWF